jgi:glyoxylase-like metal-dependent hydrolase (beta-lactamase superfamily II)
MHLAGGVLVALAVAGAGVVAVRSSGGRPGAGIAGALLIASVVWFGADPGGLALTAGPFAAVLFLLSLATMSWTRATPAMFGMQVAEMPAAGHGLEDGQNLELATIRMEVRHVPGHSPGHVILVIECERVAFVGDVIFRGSVGRTDLWGGDFATLVAGIRKRVFDLPDDTELYSGHGPPTTVGHERTTNPFLVPSYGGGLA